MNRFGVIEKPTDILRLELPVDVELCRTEKAGAPDRGRRALILDMHAAGGGGARAASAGKCPGRERTIDFAQEGCVLEQDAVHYGGPPDLPRPKGHGPFRDTALLRRIRRETTIVSSSVLCNAVYLFFWSVSDAIAFYRENKDSYQIRFTKRYLYEEERCQNGQDAEQPEVHHTPCEDFAKRDADRLRGVWRLVEAGLAPMVHGHAGTGGHVHSQFNERILFFSSMSKLFAPAELKKIEGMFRAGKASAVLANAKELCVGAQSNIMMQGVLRSLSSEQLLDFIHRLGDDIGPISATKYGAYVVQTVLELAKCGEIRSTITEYFARDFIIKAGGAGMNKINTDVAKQKLNEADKQVKGNIQNIERTTVGKKIPKEIGNVTFFDLLKCTWVAVLILDLAIVLILDARQAGTKWFSKYPMIIIELLFLVVGMLADFAMFAVFMSSLSYMFKFVFCIKMVKSVLVILVLVISSTGTLMHIFSGVFGILILILDFLFVYYLSIYFDRLESDEYDDYGIPAAKDKDGV
ncbi:UNVERIFIED_CONTAM: hypothetical protein PYX00_011642 [Menopon gallinae]|uniref:Uncharacterized protein n=1 Tax=Menopon gallinae TaxID=328185 RepID=A0AAW2H835_9NEOP